MDNFNLTPVLFEDLLAKDTAASGTICTNRQNFPKSLKPAPREKST